ncbi:uncharacterized protein EI90DRAFT_1089274 [Cantharellus anzutake]|uniref:uncharacterized protein n=1 Tax=Cantharellus anzutake TaxID=1750568 RepID=UPI00190510D0|nr:uncharacterized protein EI90DRAFT_1089274 [Cantharellus anzutake]KAF8330705.1 hypothetical protein EI90DRAFT_1089274 [Cantharellus anzutake]
MRVVQRQVSISYFYCATTCQFIRRLPAMGTAHILEEPLYLLLVTQYIRGGALGYVKSVEYP